LLGKSPDKKLAPEQEKELEDEYYKLMDEQKNYTLQFIDQHPNTILAAFILQQVNDIALENLDMQLSKFDSIMSKTPYVEALKNKAEIMRKCAVGQKYIDIRMQNPEGKEIALSDYVGKGKYVLIDFWASWCGPCRQENPNVVKLYNDYKDKGFEIVGISLDADKNSWVKAIADDKITWPQMSDLKHWENEGAKLYNVRSIPATVLIDKDGIIIADKLRGEQLRNKIAELLDVKK
jgi:peroxiredoxin